MYFTDHCNPSALKPIHCFPWYTRHYTSIAFIPTYLPPHALTLVTKIVIVTHWLLLFVYYSIALDNTNISTLSKSKTPTSTNDVETYNKETLGDKIHRLTTANIQLMTNKIKTEKAKVNLKTNKIRLFGKKNSLVTKKEEFQTEIAVLHATRSSNVPVYRYQDPLLKPIQNKLKAKRPLLFDNLKENLQKFFIRIRYYQRFYQQNLSLDSDKV